MRAGQTKQRYLCGSWQGMIRFAIQLMAKGYYFYHVIYLPMKKRDKWSQIDLKLIKKYQTNKSKGQRYRLREKGLASTFYLRWEDVALLLHTQGQFNTDIVADDRYWDVRRRPLRIQIGDTVEVEIGYRAGAGGKTRPTAWLSTSCYREIKDGLADVARTQDKERMATEFQKINGLPCFAELNRQKESLRRHLVRQAQRHQVIFSESEIKKELEIRYRDKATKIWADGNNKRAQRKQ